MNWTTHKNVETVGLCTYIICLISIKGASYMALLPCNMTNFSQRCYLHGIISMQYDWFQSNMLFKINRTKRVGSLWGSPSTPKWNKAHAQAWMTWAFQLWRTYTENHSWKWVNLKVVATQIIFMGNLMGDLNMLLVAHHFEIRSLM